MTERRWGNLWLGLLVLTIGLLAWQYQDPHRIDLALRLTAPDAAHWLGTDQLGRDVLSRVLEGAAVALGLAVVAVSLSALLGIAVGLLAGYRGGWFDAVLMRLVDMQLAIPSLLLALLVIAVLGAGAGNLLLVLVITGWTGYARIVRAEVLQLRSREFILGCQAIGASGLRIMGAHLLPNVVGGYMVVGTLSAARVVIIEASMSYLGLGFQPPVASWGRMLVEGQVYVASAWWVVTFPGLAILLAVLGANRLGAALKRRLQRDGK
ncbi:MAG: Glutathione transport system permease protein GsiD [Pseudomonas citronellolis]|nr:MAG: Glutathione transport system permease protein GsiD [Pseudomonas citronellolis]